MREELTTMTSMGKTIRTTCTLAFLAAGLLLPQPSLGKEIKLGPEKIEVTTRTVIEKGDLWVIAPGSVVSFASQGQWVVRGRIHAIGTPALPIIFTAHGSRDRLPMLVFEGEAVHPAENTDDAAEFRKIENQYRNFLVGKAQNYFAYTLFSGIRGSIGTRKTGLITLQGASLLIEASQFEEIRVFNAITANNARVFIRGSKFLTCGADSVIYLDSSLAVIDGNTLSSFCQGPDSTDEGLWSRNSTVIAYQNHFTKLGDDGAQSLGGRFLGIRNHSVSNGNDGYDGDAHASVVLLGNELTDNRNSGIKSGDGAAITSTKNRITGNRSAYAVYNGGSIFSTGDTSTKNGVESSSYGSLRNYFRREEKNPRSLAEFNRRLAGLLPRDLGSEEYWKALEEMDFEKVIAQLESKGERSTAKWLRDIQKNLEKKNRLNLRMPAKEMPHLEKFREIARRFGQLSQRALAPQLQRK